MERPDTATGTNSEMGLSAITLSNIKTLPEQWTLPQEWNIEKREMFQNWKLDVQQQIKFLDRQLTSSLIRHPTLPTIKQHCEEEDTTDPELIVGKMQYGVKRA